METSIDAKTLKETPLPPNNWDRCHVFMPRKGRFCNQFPSQGATYCGNHIHLTGSTTGRKRIPCPIDPTHMIFKDQLEKHKLQCPKFRQQQERENKPYFRRNINVGGHGTWGDTKSRDKTMEWALNFALKLLEVHQTIFTGKHPDDVRQVTKENVYDSIPMMDLSQPEMEAGLPQAVEEYRIKSGGQRHLIQQASLIGHLRRIGALPRLDQEGTPPNDITFLELGAGRGMLGLVAAGVACASIPATVRLALIERAGSRSKADTVLRTIQDVSHVPKTPYMKLKSLKWSRIQCDLSHVHMSTVINQSTSETNENTGKMQKEQGHSSKQKVVVIAKHLCGAGTDLALKSLQDIRSQLDACVMATCCHGVCSWSEYVGRDHLCKVFKDHNLCFGEHEFELLRRWSSGTVATSCQSSTEKSDAQDNKLDLIPNAGTIDEHSSCTDDPPLPFSLSSIILQGGMLCDIHGIGRACQRLIDYGRCKYIEHELKFGSSCLPSAVRAVELYHYVPATVTPQNAVLVCYKT